MMIQAAQKPAFERLNRARNDCVKVRKEEEKNCRKENIVEEADDNP